MRRKVTKANENTEAVNEVQRLIKEGQFKISREALKKLGLDTTKKSIFLRNVKLEKDSMFTDWNFCSIDKYADMDGVRVIENEKLLKRIKKYYDEGKTSITAKELIRDFNIFDASVSLMIGNFNLSSKSQISTYMIKLIKPKKVKAEE